MREFSVACNWEKELIDGLSKYPEVKWVYGKLRSDSLGGGRPSFTLPDISKEEAKTYIEYVHSKGIRFNYLFNSACLGNKEFTEEGKDKIINDLEWVIYEAKVDAITVATDYMFKLIRHRYPHVKVGIGVFKKLTDIRNFKYYDDAGAEWITFFSYFSRDIDFLRRLRKAVKCQLQFILNESELCLCPFSVFHTNTFAHMSQQGDICQGQWQDPYMFNCLLDKLRYPEKLIQVSFIQPERLPFYERLGYNNFKIVDRSKASDWILNAVSAYVNRDYEGNLLDIVNIGGEKVCAKVRSKFYEYFKNNYSSSNPNIKMYFDKYSQAFPRIDNKKAIEYLDSLYRKCSLPKEGCSDCGYCKEVARDVVDYPNLELKNELISILLNSLKNINKDKVC